MKVPTGYRWRMPPGCPLSEEELDHLSNLSVVRFYLDEFRKMRRGSFRGFKKQNGATKMLVKYGLVTKYGRMGGSGRCFLTPIGEKILEEVEEENSFGVGASEE